MNASRNARLQTVSICLAIGAVINIIVAMACAVRGDRRWNLDQDAPPSDRVHDLWRTTRGADWPETLAQHSFFRGSFFDVDWLSVCRPIPDPTDHRTDMLYRVVRGRAGWPARSMQWTVTCRMPVPGGTTFGCYDDPESVLVGGLDPIWRLGDLEVEGFDRMAYRRIPLMPIGVGFVLDSLFYAGVCLLLSWAQPTLRIRARRNRGCCVECGYLLEAAPCCPERGTESSIGQRVAAEATA